MHKQFPDRLSFLLYNPLRRRLNPPTRLISLLGLSRKDVVVDFGCGPGFYTIPLARITARTIGIDVSARMLQRAGRNCVKKGIKVELIQSDGRSLDIDEESIDLLLMVHVFHEIGNKKEVLREFSRILKVSGRLAIVERTRAGGFLSRKFGPPVIDHDEIVNPLNESRFRVNEEFHDGEDSVIIASKI